MPSLDAVAALFQAHVAAHPLLVFAAALALVAIGGRRRAGGPLLSEPALGIGGAAILALYLAQVVGYALGHSYYDHAEPSVAALSWLVIQGQAPYHDPASAERYSHVYGPWAFLLPGAVMGLLGPSIVTSKIAGACAGLLSVLASFLAVRRVQPSARAIGWTAAVALGFLMFRNYSFWNRPDALLALGAAAAMLGVGAGRPAVRESAVGIALGLMAGLKITGPLYGLGAVVLLFESGGWKAVARAAVLALLVWAAPYALWPQIDWRAHVEWLAISAANGLTWQLLWQNAAWMAFLLLPVAQRTWTRRERPDGATLATIAGMAGVAIAAAKPGAGPYHLLPFIPVLAALDAGVASGARAVLRSAATFRAAQLVAGFVLAAGSQAYFLSGLHRSDWNGLHRELTVLLEEPALARAQVGYADAGPATYLRPLAVFRSGEYLLDAPAIQEHQLSGVAIPVATIARIERCEIPVWILPRGEPFSAVNAYPQTGHRRLFPEPFRKAFLARYVRSQSGRYLDVWTCAPGPRIEVGIAFSGSGLPAPRRLPLPIVRASPGTARSRPRSGRRRRRSPPAR
jgi:hypothetical protein